MCATPGGGRKAPPETSRISPCGLLPFGIYGEWPGHRLHVRERGGVQESQLSVEEACSVKRTGMLARARLYCKTHFVRAIPATINSKSPAPVFSIEWTSFSSTGTASPL
jgi:hypothetical protein